jgi:hypothetical protein
VTRTGGIYIATAIAIELVARLVGTDRRLRFALAAGLGTATLGFAGEYAWNAGARQPWNSSLFPEVIPLALLAAVGSALVASAFAATVRREPREMLPFAAVALGGAAVIASLVIPFPRAGGDGLTAAMRLERVDADNALVHVQVEPADAAEDARWFQAVTWQGGDLALADMEPEGDTPGAYVSDKPVPAYGAGKTLVRLHTGSRMVAIPVHLPADPEIDEAEVPAVDRTAPFLREGKYLMREAKGGPAAFAIFVYVLLFGVACMWTAAFVLVGRRILRQPAPSAPEQEYALVA